MRLPRVPSLKVLTAWRDRATGSTSTPGAQLTKAAPAVILVATGAGAALWWWTQWARGRAESEAEDGTSDAPVDDRWTGHEG